MPHILKTGYFILRWHQEKSIGKQSKICEYYLKFNIIYNSVKARETTHENLIAKPGHYLERKARE
jgi:hypothetical protein